MKTYKGAKGTIFHLNTVDRPELINPIGLDRMGEHLRNFRKLHFEWLVDDLCSPQECSGSLGTRTMARGLAGSPKHGANYQSNLLKIPCFPEAAWAGLPRECSIPNRRAASISKLTLEQQQECIRRACGSSIQDLDAIVKEQRRHDLTQPAIENDFAASSSCAEFLDRLYDRLKKDSSTPVRRDRKVKEATKRIESVEARSPVIEWFFLFLAERGIALLPFGPTSITSRQNTFDSTLYSDQTRKVIDAHDATIEAVMKLPRVGRVGSVSKHHVRERKTFLLLFFYCCDYRATEPVDHSLFDELYEISNAKPASAARHQSTRFIQRVMNSMTSGKVMTFTEFNKRATPRSRFKWVDLDYSEKTASRFPDAVPHDYRARPHLGVWADRFLEEARYVRTKDFSAHLSAYHNFVIWMAWAGHGAEDVTDFSREDMNDALIYSNSKCFRAFVGTRGISEVSASGIITKMAAFFDRQIERRQLQIANPIVIRFDVFSGEARRGKTPRFPLGREMMEYIREYNKRNDFAFSKGSRLHYRLFHDAATKEVKSIWYPAIPIMIDFLLRIPVRSFQVRHLDSGEGDELLPNVDGFLEYYPNDGALARKGRKEFALAIMPGLNSQHILGLYINTNKTSIDRAGYEIPWSDHDLVTNILYMRDWQLRYNPISEPILCMDGDPEPQNPDAHAAVQRCFPLFRDPGNLGNNPPSRASLKRYWDDLLAAVQTELRANGRPQIKLVEHRTIDKGNNNSVERDIALFDIHTLRVSGITALIEAGLPPDMVMSVAGHSTVVMTLYYNRGSASRLNARLQEYMEKVTDQLGEVDVEIPDRFLINTRDEKDRCGALLYRERYGHDAAAIQYMSHGICPGGQCSTGGEWTNQAVGHSPVPRPLACSMCRYRLTGPMFLPGLVCNANRLLYEVHERGEEIVELNRLVREDDKRGRSSNAHRSKVASLYRETDIIMQEWIAEVAYVRKAEAMMAEFLDSIDTNASCGGDRELPMIGGERALEIVARLEEKSEFALLQALSDGQQEVIGFRPSSALADHREMLNEILNANSIRPFLLSLSGDMRDFAANRLGRAIVEGIPDEEVARLCSGDLSLDAYPNVMRALRAIENNTLLNHAHPGSPAEVISA